MKAVFPFLLVLLALGGLCPGTARAEWIPNDPHAGLYYDAATRTAIWVKRKELSNEYEAWVCPPQPLLASAPGDTLGWYHCTPGLMFVQPGGQTDQLFITFRHNASGFRYAMHGAQVMDYPVHWGLMVYGPDTNSQPSSNTLFKFGTASDNRLATVDAQYRTYLSRFGRENIPADSQAIVEPEAVFFKPVIYLYPTVPTDVSVSLRVPNEAGLITYPPLEDSQWRVTAQPNGTLTLQSTGAQYPNLFWEAPLGPGYAHYVRNGGWEVARQHLVPFLEARLAEMNFNAQERTEFIQFWWPRMAQHDTVTVHFAFVGHHAVTGPYTNPIGETFAGHVPLDISPAPDNLLRVMMVWNVGPNGPRPPQPQTLPRLTRTGFHVLEWGGVQIGNPIQ